MPRRKTTRSIAASPREHRLSPEEVHERILGTKEVLERVPINRTTLWQMVQDERFPAPIHLTAHRIGWRLSAVLRWIAEREADPLARREYPVRDKQSA